ncbi:MAG: TonB-dependent receptor [Pseudomonadota bacterium]
MNGRVACILALLPAAVAAQQAPVEEIVVTATRLPQSAANVPFAISIVDDLDAGYQQVGLDEALTRVPGVFLQDRYNFAQDLRIAIRGFGARSSFGIRGVKLVVDGIPLTLPDGQGQLDSLDLASAERVEILRGPAAALYGNAAGGLIKVTSERAGATPYAAAGLGVGADGFRRATAKWSAGFEGQGLLLSASALDFDGFRSHARTRQRLFNGVYRRATGGDGELVVTANIADQPLAEDPGGVNAAQASAEPASARSQNVQFDAGEALTQWRLGVSWDRAAGADKRMVWRAYAVDRDFSNRLPFTSAGQVDLDRQVFGAGVTLSRASTSSLRWLLGLDIDEQRDRRQRFDNLDGSRGPQQLDQQEDVRAAGVFAALVYAPTDRWQFTVGGRYDWLRFRVTDDFLADGNDSGLRRFRQFSPQLGAVVALNDGWSMFANVARSFESPTTTEYANPAGGGFNPTIEPAIARSAEIGWRWRRTAFLSAEFTVFRIDLRDELIPFELASEPGRDFFANAGTSRRDGAELSLAWAATKDLSIESAITLNDFRFRRFVADDGSDFSGLRTPGIPRHIVAVSAQYQFSDNGFAALDITRFGAIALNNIGSEQQRAYTVVGLRSGWTFAPSRHAIRLTAGINNLLDEDYPANVRINAFGGRFFEPAPPRHLYVGLEWRFGQAKR